MIKSGTIKSVLILVFIGMALIGLVQPIAGDTMGKDSSQDGQYSSNDECDDSSQDGQYSSCAECNDSNWNLDNESCPTQAEMECANYWMKHCMMIHYMHIKNPSTATEESQMEMMHDMMKAYECMTGENMTMDMMDKMACDGSEGWMNATTCDKSEWMNTTTCDKSEWMNATTCDKSEWMNATTCDKSSEWMNSLVDKGSMDKEPTCNVSSYNQSSDNESYDSGSCDSGSADNESCENGSVDDESAGC